MNGRKITRIVQPAFATPEWSCRAKLSYRTITTSQTTMTKARKASMAQNTLRNVHSYARTDTAPPLVDDDHVRAELAFDLGRGIRSEQPPEPAVVVLAEDDEIRALVACGSDDLAARVAGRPGEFGLETA